MGSRATKATPRAPATVNVPAFNAFVVAPIVGSVVLMLVAVRATAAAIGALSAFVGRASRGPAPRERIASNAVESPRS